MKNILIWAGISLFVAGSIFGLAMLVNSKPSSVLSQTTVNVPAVTKQDMTVGNPNSRVILVEYSDFECPACAIYHTFTKQLIEEKGDQILFVYRFFPLDQHKYALLSSKTAYSSGLQGKFREMEDLLFENQAKWAGNDKALEIFFSYAKSLNLDMDKFQKDLNDSQTAKVIEESYNSGVSLGITSTPTFFLNNKEIKFKNYAELKNLVEKELKK